MEQLWIQSSIRNICFGSHWTERPQGPRASGPHPPRWGLVAGLNHGNKKHVAVGDLHWLVMKDVGARWRLLGVQNAAAVSGDAPLTVWDFPWHSTASVTIHLLLRCHSIGFYNIHNKRSTVPNSQHSTALSWFLFRNVLCASLINKAVYRRRWSRCFLSHNNASRVGRRRNNREVKSWARSRRPDREKRERTPDPWGFVVYQKTLSGVAGRHPDSMPPLLAERDHLQLRNFLHLYIS